MLGLTGMLIVIAAIRIILAELCAYQSQHSSRLLTRQNQMPGDLSWSIEMSIEPSGVLN